MKKLCLAFLSILCAVAVCSCASSSSSSSKSTSSATPTNVSLDENGQVSDCNAFEQEFADGCFHIAVYDQNDNLRDDVDENGNNLGPVDQAWASSYCTCFAQTAFEQFGCNTVYSDFQMEQPAWLEKYAVIQKTCSEKINAVIAEEANASTADASTDAAATDAAATDAAATDTVATDPASTDAASAQ